MNKMSINLPLGRRLDLQLVTRHGLDVEKDPILPSIKRLRRLHGGSLMTRFFRLIFEHKWSKKILGANFALAIMLGSILPSTINADTAFEADGEAAVISTQISLKTEVGIQYPTEEVKINQGYHLFHPGIDYDGEIGDPVFPIMPGYVESIDQSRFAYGNSIILRHGDSVTSLYAHLSKILVEEGQTVDLKTVIGEVGSTGHSTGSHLHLEIREDNYPINPNSILPQQ